MLCECLVTNLEFEDDDSDWYSWKVPTKQCTLKLTVNNLYCLEFFDKYRSSLCVNEEYFDKYFKRVFE